MGPCPCGCVVACWSRVKVLICVAAMASLARALSVLEECASRRRLRQECERSSAVRMEWAAATLLTCCGVHAHVGVCLACGPQLTFYPLGKEIRNVRCMRCGVWGHRSGDRECKVETNPNDAARLKREDPMTSMKVPSRLLAHTAAHTRLDSRVACLCPRLWPQNSATDAIDMIDAIDTIDAIDVGRRRLVCRRAAVALGRTWCSLRTARWMSRTLWWMSPACTILTRKSGNSWRR